MEAVGIRGTRSRAVGFLELAPEHLAVGEHQPVLALTLQLRATVRLDGPAQEIGAIRRLLSIEAGPIQGVSIPVGPLARARTG